MKQILVPTDFSEAADNALLYAIDLANEEKAKIMLLHVFNAEDGAEYINDPRKKLMELAMKMGQEGTAHEIIYKEGTPVKAILEVVGKKKPDLIIMGTKGQNDFANMILGSNTSKIIEQCECNIIVVPEGVSLKPLRKITYATDYRSDDLFYLKQLVEIAQPRNAQVNILHIALENEEPADEKRLMEDFMQSVNKNLNYSNLSFQICAGKNIEERLRDHIEEDSADLLAISTHHNGLWNKIFGRGLTRRMADNSPVLLMVFHARKASVAYSE